MPVEVWIVAIVMGAAGSVGALSVILAFKIKKKELETQSGDPGLGPVVDALRDELADVQEHTRARLEEMEERLDFAERLLTAGSASQDKRSE